MNFEAIKLRKIDQRTLLYGYIWNLKKLNSQRQRVQWWLSGLEDGGMGEGGQRVQPSVYKRNQFWGCNVQHDDNS